MQPVAQFIFDKNLELLEQKGEVQRLGLGLTLGQQLSPQSVVPKIRLLAQTLRSNSLRSFRWSGPDGVEWLFGAEQKAGQLELQAYPLPPAAVAEGGAEVSQWLRYFADHAPFHFGISDPKNRGTFLQWNASSERMFGYAPEEAIGKLTARDLHADEREFQEVLAQVDHGGFQGECSFLRKDGFRFPGRLIVIPIFDDEGQIIERCGFIEDLTEQKKTEKLLEAARSARHHQDRIHQMGRLAGAVAHDINNQLSAIICAADLLKDSVPEKSEGRADLEVILGAVRSASALMRKLLVFTGRQVTVRHTICFQDWMQQTTSFFKRLLSEKVQLKLVCEAPGWIYFDHNDLEQVMVNLLVNSDKAMPSGGEIIVRCWQSEESTHISVEDPGVGMSRALQDKVFEPFYTTRDEGTGLGLSNVRELMENAGGTLRLTSAPQQGTTVHLMLPKAPAVGSRQQSGPAPAMSNKKLRGQVLLVEDQAHVRDSLTKSLRYLGLQVSSVGSLQQARYRLARMERLQVLLTDSRLPDGSGVELLPEVKAVYPEATCLLMSGYLGEEQQGENQAFDGFLAKPFTRELLWELLHNQLSADTGESEPEV